MTAVLELDGIGYHYPRTRSGRGEVLRDVCMTVAAGESVGIVGDNGSGKSTLLKIMSTLLRPTRGVVRFRGEPLPGSLRRYRSVLNYCAGAPQGFYPRLTARQNLAFFSGMKGRMLTRTQTDVLLDRVGLSESADVAYSRFSLGMRQRLHLAALSLEPAEIWILDEPTNGLDGNGLKLLERLLTAGEGRLARVVVSHDEDFLARTTGRVLRLREGELAPCVSSSS